MKTSGYELARTEWQWESPSDGHWRCETLRTAAICESARLLGNIDSTLLSILSRLDSLGEDGLHRVIRRYATRQDEADARARRRERQRSRARRAKARKRGEV